MLEFKVKRVYRAETYTIGHVYYTTDSGTTWTYFSDCLEDRDRFYRGEKKIKGQTAIHTGRYKFIVNYSNHFKDNLPLLLNTPEFEYIRIHWGNTVDATEGCLLFGENRVKGQVVNTRATIEKLMEMLTNSKQASWYITVE
jgi:hypothetical protein